MVHHREATEHREVAIRPEELLTAREVASGVDHPRQDGMAGEEAATVLHHRVCGLCALRHHQAMQVDRVTMIVHTRLVQDRGRHQSWISHPKMNLWLDRRSVRQSRWTKEAVVPRMHQVRAMMFTLLITG
jgi:hypothetical protein